MYILYSIISLQFENSSGWGVMGGGCHVLTETRCCCLQVDFMSKMTFQLLSTFESSYKILPGGLIVGWLKHVEFFFFSFFFS